MEFAGIDKFSLLDYDQMVSIVLFTPGCNFRCPFCHNIESVVDSKYRLRFDDILAYLASRKHLFDAVVISGGEPTLQNDLKETIIKIRELGFKIKLDTNGTNPKVIRDLVDNKLVDYIAMDIKNSLSKYDLTTGVSASIDKINESITILKEDKVDYEFRTTLIDEFHDEQSINDIASLLKGSKKLFLQKFVVRDGVINKNLHPVEMEKAYKYRDILIHSINKVELRGY